MLGTSIASFRAEGILGNRVYQLNFDSAARVIVGPNGTGKSTFLSLFYLFITQQWARLNEYEFTGLVLGYTGGEIKLTKAALRTFQETRTQSVSSRRFADRLIESNMLDLIYKSTLSKDEKERLQDVTGISTSQINSFRMYLRTELGFSEELRDAESKLSQLNLGTVVYLPTYRRIEKDIQSIFPDIEERIRERFERDGSAGRRGKNFIEISGFGMKDVRALVDRSLMEVGEFRRQSIENASQEYIRDIVRGHIKSYSLTNLRKLSDDDLRGFEESLNTTLFTDEDRSTLADKIGALRTKIAGQPNSESRFLGMFVERLVHAHNETKKVGAPLQKFLEIIRKYLGPAKNAIISDNKLSIVSGDHDRGSSELAPLDAIDFDKLSSGEKQIVAMFAYLILSGKKDLIVLIDEPELSLSVPWQKSFLPDILSSGSCRSVVAVTHSPFVFDNELRGSLLDVRKLEVLQ